MPAVAPRPLGELTTLRTGAAPERMVDAHSRAELIDALHEVWAEGDPWLVLGGGSNLLVGDDPFPGTVIRALSTGIERIAAPSPGHVRLRIQAGHQWDALVAQTVTEGLAGIEAMSGIPGTVGAAPVQNIGAYGQEIVQTLVEVELIDEATGQIQAVPAAELGLGFRTSVLKQHYGSVAARSAVILSVTLELSEVGSEPRTVPGTQLRSALRLSGDDEVSLADTRSRVLEIRRGKGMVLDENDPDTYSAGSFFQNAVVSASFARTLPPDCPQWPVGPDPVADRVIPLDSYYGLSAIEPLPEPEVKVSAGWLIEQSGIHKGFSLPPSRAAISTKHALALTNRNQASAEEIAQLARFVQDRVRSEFGLVLQPEPVLIGVDL